MGNIVYHTRSTQAMPIVPGRSGEFGVRCNGIVHLPVYPSNLNHPRHNPSETFGLRKTRTYQHERGLKKVRRNGLTHSMNSDKDQSIVPVLPIQRIIINQRVHYSARRYSRRNTRLWRHPMACTRTAQSPCPNGQHDPITAVPMRLMYNTCQL